MFLTWFKKPQKEPTPLAIISYVIKSDASGPYINIELSDYNSESAEAICEILDTLANESAYVQTINMLKTFLLKDGQEELLIKILATISKTARDKLIASNTPGDQPCIKPSDMI